MTADISAAELAEIEKTLNTSAPKPAPEPSDKLKVFLDPKQLKIDLAYSEATIGEATMQQASMFSSYAALASRAQHQLDTMKNRLEIIEATIDKELRDEAVTAGTKVTETGLAKAIVLDARYQAAQKRVTDAKLIASLCEQAREAFRQRMFMLIQAGKDQQVERQGELRQMELDRRREALVKEMERA